MNKKILGTLFVMSLVVIVTGCTTSQQETQEQQLQNVVSMNEGYVVDPSDNVHSRNLLENIEKSELSEEEKNGLILMREEEKLAHDVYTVLYEKWGQKTFNNIARSEQTHTDTVKVLLDKYEIADPVVSNEVGMFAAPEMQKLYDDLVAKGSVSLVEALTVGAIVEDLDISDLNKLLAETDNEDIQIAYQNLNKGSRNHLRAYVRQLERNGGEYTPQYISQVEYDKIIAGEQERGSVDAKGQGQGQGSQNGQGRRGHGNGGGQGKSHIQ
ncbi:MAG: DUF2202 domain-containing protein [Patescibacteria group bacterium]|nr:DUF2202 domain-containing protein [Patescibacteria group bacterium]